MTPYTKKIVELHKIHKAIENCGCNKDEQGGGDENSSWLMQCVPNSITIKPDLFVLKDSEAEIPTYNDVTNITLEDIINLISPELTNVIINAAYNDVSNITTGSILKDIMFDFETNNEINIYIHFIDAANKLTYPIIIDGISYQCVYADEKPI